MGGICLTHGCPHMVKRHARTKQPKIKTVALTLLGLATLLYLNNASFWVKPQRPGPMLMAHRGLGQDYEREGLTNDTCTAAQMRSTPHNYLENTIPSMQAAYDYGADFVEFDIHPTVDGKFAVFHDWTIDCRTEGNGITREQTFEYLQTLDIGYGYTADDGQTYPYRGKGVGMMPTLEQVLTSFPDRNLIINIKSQDPREGMLLADRLAQLSPERQEQILVYGGAQPVSIIRERLPKVRTLWIRQLKQCLLRYMLLGWSGYVPEKCDRSMLMVPMNVAPWLWGWPHRFIQRMENAGTHVFVIGDYNGEGFSQGVDDPDRLSEIPYNFSGGIWTNRIDLIGPAVKETRTQRP